MTDAFYTDEKRDMPTQRKMGLSENDFVIKQDGDPYGFWRISREKGQIPVQLSGAYTSAELAKQAVIQYVSQNK